MNASEKIEGIFEVNWKCVVFLAHYNPSFSSFLPFFLSFLLSFLSFKMSSLHFSVLNDEMFRMMSDPTIRWGDLCLEEEKMRPTSSITVEDDAPRAIIISFEEEALEGWAIPDLRLRKAIWENFPVDVIPIRSDDGTDRYKICWNEARVKQWRNTRAESLDEYQDYEGFCEVRLMTALNAHPHKYVVEEARDDKSLCVIAMVHAPVEAVPVTTNKRALDVLSSFPISWDRDGKVHRIKLHRKRAGELGVKESDVTFDLMGSLAECCDCVVTPACGGGYMMIVTLL